MFVRAVVGATFRYFLQNQVPSTGLVGVVCYIVGSRSQLFSSNLSNIIILFPPPPPKCWRRLINILFVGPISETLQVLCSG